MLCKECFPALAGSKKLFYMYIKNAFWGQETEELRSLMIVYLEGVPSGTGMGLAVCSGLTTQKMYLVVFSQRHGGTLYAFTSIGILLFVGFRNTDELYNETWIPREGLEKKRRTETDWATSNFPSHLHSLWWSPEKQWTLGYLMKAGMLLAGMTSTRCRRKP